MSARQSWREEMNRVRPTGTQRQTDWQLRCGLAAPGLLVASLLLGAIGCSTQAQSGIKRGGTVSDVQRVTLEEEADRISRNPLLYIEECYQRAVALQAYSLRFIRQERRGLFNAMQPLEDIDAKFRREPFSLYLNWRNEDLKYGESVYVAGANEDKVRFVTRFAIPFLKAPPGINAVGRDFAQSVGESRRSVTDFGLDKLLKRTIDTVAEVGRANVRIEYVGWVEVERTGRTAHHLRLTYDPATKPVNTQDLYIDVRTGLPVGTELRLPNGALDAQYYYLDVRAREDFSDADFLLSVEEGSRNLSPTRARE